MLEQLPDHQVKLGIRKVIDHLKGAKRLEPVVIHEDELDDGPSAAISANSETQADPDSQPSAAVPVDLTTESTEATAGRDTSDAPNVESNTQETLETPEAPANEPTATQQSNIPPPPPAPEPRSPIRLSRYQAPDNEHFVHASDTCFDTTNRGEKRTAINTRKAKSVAVTKVVKSITSQKSLTTEQKVIALRDAMKHPKIRHLAVNAGLMVTDNTEQSIMKNIRGTIKKMRQTKHWRGRVTDDQRSVVQTLVMCALGVPGECDKVSMREGAKALGLPRMSFQRLYKSVAEKRKSIAEETANGGMLSKESIYSQVVKSKGWRKCDQNLEKIIHDWIRRHPHVIQSPITNDTVLVPDPNDPKKKIKKHRLLLQISVRELHNDLIKEVPEVMGPDGNPLVSDTKLRMILPPELSTGIVV